jgi:hypothetical protein
VEAGCVRMWDDCGMMGSYEQLWHESTRSKYPSIIVSLVYVSPYMSSGSFSLM